jgi:hypothetical protein
MSNTGDQAQDTFQKMEDIAKRNIQSIKGGFSIFVNEVVKNTTSDGFLHGKSQYSTSLNNNGTGPSMYQIGLMKGTDNTATASTATSAINRLVDDTVDFLKNEEAAHLGKEYIDEVLESLSKEVKNNNFYDEKKD